MAEFLHRVARAKPTYRAFRSGICFLLTLLLVLSVENRIHAGSTLFEDDYEDCLGNQRLSDVLDNLEASRPAADYELQLTWTATDPATWNIETLEADLTIIVKGPMKTMTRDLALGVRTALFDENEIDMAQHLSIEMAVTVGDCVMSDIVETEFTSGMFRPDLSSPFFWDGNMMYKENNNLPVGQFYFLGFGRNFDNWYVDLEETPKFRVGLRHGLAQPLEGEFLHYRLQVTDGNGDDILGYYPATVTSPEYENTNLALGAWTDADFQPQNMAEFGSIRRSNHPDTPTPAALDLLSPVSHYWDSKVAGSFPQIFSSASVESAYDHRLSFADLADIDTRVLYAHPPDHFYSLPVDTFDLDDRYTITAWAENGAGQRISDFGYVTFRIQEILTLENVYSNLQPLAIRPQRPPRVEPTVIKSRSYGTDLRAVAEAVLVDLLILDQSPTASSKTGHNWHSTDNNVGLATTNNDGSNDGGNSDPVFQAANSMVTVENISSLPRITAQDSDSQDTIESFSLVGGADASLFNFNSRGDLAFKAAPDFERPGDSNANNEYLVDISVTSGTGARARTVTQTFTVIVTDATEVPGAPQSLNAPSTTNSITLNWQEPDNNGPDLNGYQVQYREESTENYQDFTTTDNDVFTVTIPDLDPSTRHMLQVRSRSPEGDSPWVQISQDTLDMPNADPVLQATTRLSVAENTTSVGTITAQDDDSQDSIVSFEIDGGADASLFDIGLATGALAFKAAPDYERPGDSNTNNEYLVGITVTSGAGARAKTATQTFTVVVTDATEIPGVPKSVTATATTTTITLSWQAADNKGPALTGYQVQYRVGATGTYLDVTTTAGGVLTATVSGRTPATSHMLRVRSRSPEGDSAWVEITQATVAAPNADPVLQGTTRLSVAENTTSVSTITAQDGDSQDSIVSFEIDGGADASLFDIGLATGALAFKAAPDYERPGDSNTNNEYLVGITVTSGAGARAKTATQTFTVVVTDATEIPGVPKSVTATATTTTITLSWQAADNKGPALTGYQVQYRVGATGTYLDVTTTAGGVLTATVSGRTPATSHMLRVRSRSPEGDSAWVEITQATVAAPNADPVLQSTTRLSVAENTTSVSTITAQDGDSQDSIVSFEIDGGADASLFEIGLATGALAFKVAPDYERPGDSNTNNEYLVGITVTSGAGARAKTATQTFTVVVTDATEIPGVPKSVTATATATTITLNWQAADNKGPALTGYQVQYRVGATGTYLDVTTTAGGVLTATVSGRTPSTTHMLRVRSRSAEGDSAWVEITQATVAAPNADPVLQGTTRLSVAENTTSVSTITAQDGDSQDSIVSFEIDGGADASLFEIGLATGALAFKVAPDYERPGDSNTNNEYLVGITVTSGAGARAKTATQTFTVVVTDATEIPGVPKSVTATATTTTITLSWQAADNKGPALTGYQVQYRVGATGTYLDVTTTAGGVLTATVSGRTPATSHMLRVRSRSPEGDSAWVEITQATLAAPNADPVLQGTTRLSVAENTTSVSTITAQDGDSQDSIVSFEIDGGADASLFDIGLATGALAFKVAPDYERPGDSNTNNEYLVGITVTSGAGARAKTATQTFTVVVTDATEIPGVPKSVTATATTTTITLSWQAADNKGPALTGYQVQYRVGATGTYLDVTTTAGGVLTATVSGRTPATSHMLRVRSRSPEGDSAWVEITQATQATQTTQEASNADPVLQTTTRLSVEENTTSVSTITAQDGDSQDSIVSFEIDGGVDASLFEIGQTTGDLTFKVAPDYERATDSNIDNEYLVGVTVTSGAGDRAKTATQTFTVVVTDATEIPGVPKSLTATATATTITLNWLAADNKGPALTGYQVQFREGNTGTFEDVETTAADVLTETVIQLSPSTSYTLQVRTRSPEGDSAYVQITQATATPSVGSDAEDPDCAGGTGTICQISPGTPEDGGTDATDDEDDTYFFNAAVGYYRLIVQTKSPEYSSARLRVYDPNYAQVFVTPAADMETDDNKIEELIYDFAIETAGKYYISMHQLHGASTYNLNLTRRSAPGQLLQVGTPITGRTANTEESKLIVFIGGKGKSYTITFEGGRSAGFTGSGYVGLNVYGPENTGITIFNNSGSIEHLADELVVFASSMDATLEFDTPTTGGYWLTLYVYGWDSLEPVVEYTLTLAEKVDE